MRKRLDWQCLISKCGEVHVPLLLGSKAGNHQRLQEVLSQETVLVL